MNAAVEEIMMRSARGKTGFVRRVVKEGKTIMRWWDAVVWRIVRASRLKGLNFIEGASYS